MNAEELLRHYERVADVPDAIARLRQFVLDLAVRGKLAQLDSSDESALDLAARLTVEKRRLKKIGVIKHDDTSSPIDPTCLPLDTPSHWAWVRLRDIGRLSGGMTPSMNKTDYWGGDVVWLSPKDIKADEASDSELKITAKGLAETRLEAFPTGSLFIVARSGILKRTLPVAINRVAAAANQDMKVLVPYEPGMERYLQIMFRGMTDWVLRELVKTGTTVQSLKYAEFEVQPFPIPPLAEQHRIVAKVDELMALCDRLEAARAEREAARDRLTAATLARLSTPDPETFADDARFALDALSALTARPDQVKQLRRTILTLAVRGKLLRSRATSEDDGTRITLAEAELPPQWRWACAEEICEVIVDCPHSTPKFVPNGVVCLDTNAFKGGAILPAKVRYVTEQDYEVRTKRLIPRPGDIVFAREGSVGESVIVPDAMRCCLGQRVMLFRPLELLDSSYFQLALSEPSSLTRLLALHKGIGAKHVNVADMRKALIPLPPLTEQRLIVAKVKELMSWCDQLEASLQSATEHRSRLLAALLRDALDSGDHFEEFHSLLDVTAA